MTAIRAIPFAFALSLVGPPPESAADPPEPKQILALLEQAQQKAIEAAKPSVVCVMVSRSNRYGEFEVKSAAESPGTLGGFEPPRLETDPRQRDLARRLDLSDPDHIPETAGSGVVVDAGGLILTNYHLVRDATKVYVRLPGGGGSYANIHAADERADLAVLRLIDPPRRLKPVRIVDTDTLKEGSFVVALTYPFAFGFRDGGASSSVGIVSGLRQRTPGPSEEWQRVKPLRDYGILIRTDARFAVSGGALVNFDGELVALTSRLLGPTAGEASHGFAVPMDENIRRIVAVLKQGREVEYGFLGVSLSEVQEGKGVRLQFVSRGSPADKAGLRANDLIVAIDDHTVENVDDLFLFVGAALAGTEVRIRYLVGGAGPPSESRPVELMKLRHDLEAVASSPPPPVRGLSVDYASLLMSLATQSEIPAGVVVTRVEPDSPADRALRDKTPRGAQLLITEVGGKAVGSPAEFRKAAGAVPGPLRLTVRDAGRLDETPITITIPGS